jgi:hypothetical protein
MVCKPGIESLSNSVELTAHIFVWTFIITRFCHIAKTRSCMETFIIKKNQFELLQYINIKIKIVVYLFKFSKILSRPEFIYICEDICIIKAICVINSTVFGMDDELKIKIKQKWLYIVHPTSFINAITNTIKQKWHCPDIIHKCNNEHNQTKMTLSRYHS